MALPRLLIDNGEWRKSFKFVWTRVSLFTSPTVVQCFWSTLSRTLSISFMDSGERVWNSSDHSQSLFMSLTCLKANLTNNASRQWQAGHSCSKILDFFKIHWWASLELKRQKSRFFANPTRKWENGWTRDSSWSKSEDYDYPRTRRNTQVQRVFKKQIKSRCWTKLFSVRCVQLLFIGPHWYKPDIIPL